MYNKRIFMLNKGLSFAII